MEASFKYEIELPVRDIMSHNVVTSDVSESVFDIVEKMKDHNIGCVIITKDEKPVGVVTEKDIVKKALIKGKDLSKIRAENIASTPLITIHPDARIVDAVSRMNDKHVRKLPVFKGDELVGIITDGDVINTYPVFVNILSEMVRMSDDTASSMSNSGIVGYCEDCKNYGMGLAHVDGILLCRRCRGGMD